MAAQNDQFLIAGPTYIHIAPKPITAVGANFVDYGLLDVEIPIAHQVREIPTYKSFATHGQTGRDEVTTVSFQLDFNMITWWLMWMYETTRNNLYIQRGFQGTASGKPKEDICIAVTNFARVESDNIYRIQIQGNRIGEVTDGAF